MSWLDYCVRCPRCGACMVVNTDGMVYCPRCGWVGRIEYKVTGEVDDYWWGEEE